MVQPIDSQMATDGLDHQGMHVAFGDNWATDINIDPSHGPR